MSLLSRARAIAASGVPVAILRVTRVQGSAPREIGAQMLVTPNGIIGSIGGGTLEWKALAQAQRMLGKGHSRQTSRYGHVGKALVFTLSQMEMDVVWCDPRPMAFPSHVPANVTLQSDQDVPTVLVKARPGSIALVMSHSHALDLAIVDASLRNPNVVATGLIGSATKRARFETRLAAAGVPADRISALICPIGIGGIRSKRPEAIAISTAAQLLALDESLKLAEACPAIFLEHQAASQ
jgi:xanthine/CO dehydrogenase XdhC/CoxF family maturation factor